MSMFDTLGLMMIFFVIAIAVVLMHFSSNLVINAVGNSTILQNDSTWNTTKTNIQAGFNSFDFIIACFFLGSVLYIFLSAFIFESHPFFMILGVLFMVVVLFISPFISNAYGEFISNSAFTEQETAFPILNWIMQNLPLVMVGIGVLTLIVSMAKPGSM